MKIAEPTPRPKNFASQRRSAVPSRKLSGEALFISAIINTGDVSAIRTYGITKEHFAAWSKPFVWITGYVDRYEGACPSPDAFRTQFPDFPLAEHDDCRSAADMLLSTYYKNQGAATLQQAAEMFAGDEIAEAATLLQQFKVRETAAPSSNLVSDASFLDTYYDEGTSDGVPFPWEPLQAATGGMHPGNLIYFAARTGQGKSSLAVSAAINAVTMGYRVKYFSLEMSEAEMRYKVHAHIARELGFKNITARRLLDRNVDRDEYKSLMEAIDGQAKWSRFDVHTPRQGIVTPLQVLAQADEYDLVVVDLVSLMANNRGEQAIRDWRIAAEISNELKQIALSCATPILGTVQINREGAAGDRPPKIHQLAQSDSYGQDGDIVATLRTVGNVVNRWSIEKARFGSGKMFCTAFDPDTMHFPVITEDEFEMRAVEAQED